MVVYRVLEGQIFTCNSSYCCSAS